MILAIDIGNTNVVMGCIDEERTHFIVRLSTDKKKTDLEYAIQLKNILELYNVQPGQLKGSIISSVVPQLTDLMKSAAERVTGKEAKVVGPGLKTGLNILTDHPAQTGSDLIVDAVAAIAEYPVPLVIIDMGTATTISVVNEKRNYIGGMILPGIRSAMDSLVANAAQLSQVSLDVPKKLIGSNTKECMQSGAIYGNAALLDGMIDRIEADLGQKVTVVATGGLAKKIIPHCTRKIILEDDLLLKGLLIIYNKNQ